MTVLEKQEKVFLARREWKKRLTVNYVHVLSFKVEYTMVVEKFRLACSTQCFRGYKNPLWNSIVKTRESVLDSSGRKKETDSKLRLGHISTPDNLVRDISAWIFHHRNILAWGPYGSMGVPAHGHSVSMDITIWRLFGAGNFRHVDVSAQRHFGTETLWYWDILV